MASVAVTTTQKPPNRMASSYMLKMLAVVTVKPSRVTISFTSNSPL